MALVVITGGARSGKSSAATALAASRARTGERVTCAVFGRAEDPEMADRIGRHRADRPAGFETLEVRHGDWLGSAPEDGLLFVDCLGTWLGLVMEELWPSLHMLADAERAQLPDGYAASVEARFLGDAERLSARTGDTLVVTNEVGEGVVPEWASGRLFRDVLGLANRLLIARADRAYACIAGRLIDLTALPTRAMWPED